MSVLESARADIETRRTDGELDGGFARDNLAFRFPDASADAGPWRVLMVAMPRPAHVVTFLIGGRRFEAVLPPTYERYRPVSEDVRRRLIADVLPTSRVEIVDIPLKAVASRLGLVRYGQNNLTYAPSIGSYLQLIGFVTDAELPLDRDWREQPPRMLDDCGDCAVCEAVCPTDAISSDRMLLRAERCLTLANEARGGWPPWVEPSAHHCLVGCLRCQQSCPANPELRFEDTSVVFDEHETSSLLAGAEPPPPVADSIRPKLDQLGQPGLEGVLGRNLRALVDATRTAREPRAFAF
jgi:epoxyqueuosine reductase